MLKRWIVCTLLMSPFSLAYAFDAKVSNLMDLGFGTVAPFGPASSVNEDVCIYADNNQYSLTVSSNANAGAFEMLSTGGPETIPYEVFWNNTTGTNGNVQLSANQALVFSNANPAVNCGGQKNANIEINIPAASLEGALAGSYYATITILIGPAVN